MTKENQQQSERSKKLEQAPTSTITTTVVNSPPASVCNPHLCEANHDWWWWLRLRPLVVPNRLVCAVPNYIIKSPDQHQRHQNYDNLVASAMPLVGPRAQQTSLKPKNFSPNSTSKSSPIVTTTTTTTIGVISPSSIIGHSTFIAGTPASPLALPPEQALTAPKAKELSPSSVFHRRRSRTTTRKGIRIRECNHNQVSSSSISLPSWPVMIITASLVAQVVMVASFAFALQSSDQTATCFGGLQTFEKISMSSFEPSPILTSPPGSSSTAAANNPNAGAGGGGGSGGGVLVQQDDQALTSECVNLCKSQSNCLSFVIDYNRFECKSYATTQQQLQQQYSQSIKQQQHPSPMSPYASASSISSQTTTSNFTNYTVSSGGIGPILSDATTDRTTATPVSGSEMPQALASIYQHRLLLPSTSANYFEKICLAGVATRQEFAQVCGQDRLWAIERVVDSFLDGYVEREIANVNTKDECSKLCLFENQFVCRSADYDQHQRLCRLSKEDRRTQPQAFRSLQQVDSGRHYIENQCATPGPSSCVYELKRNVGIVSMDALKFAQNINDCQMKCNQEQTFNCRSYSYYNNRCFLSGDDSVSLTSNVKLPIKINWQFGERKCVVELCTKGVFSYEKTTGYSLRSALSTPLDLMTASSSSFPDPLTTSGTSTSMSMSNLLRRTYQADNITTSSTMISTTPQDDFEPDDIMASMSSSHHHHRQRYQHRTSGNVRASNSNLAITGQCRKSCDMAYLNCPSFTIDYKNNRCQRLDRNSQGRHQDLVAHDGHSYFEKICLRVPEIMSMCQDKYWIFERVPGYELAPHLYDKRLKFVQSRRDCEEYCLEEKQFQCRSALYNDETSDCWLSRTDRRLSAHDGYYRNFNAKVSYLENQCIRNQNEQLEGLQPPVHDGSQMPQQHCRYEQPRDEPAYPTFTEVVEIIPSGTTTTATNGASAGSNTSITSTGGGGGGGDWQHGSSYCEQLCNDNSKFECHSFGYYASTAQCFLSGDDLTSGGEGAITTSPGFVYYEKRCSNIPAGNTTTNANSSGPGGFAPPGSTTTTTSTTATSTTIGSSSGSPYSPGSGGFILGGIPTTTTSAGTSTTSGSSGGGGGSSLGTNDHQQFDGQRPTMSGSSPGQQTNININIGPTIDQGGRQPAQPPAVVNSTGGTQVRGQSESDHNQQHQHNQLGSTTNLSMDLSGDNGADADTYKCGQGAVFTYQRISGFEPIGGFLTLLLRDNNQAGIVNECAHLCRRAFECRAFVVDYASNQCYAMLENSSIGQLSLRQSIGRDYFEGFCLAQQHLLVGNPSSPPGSGFTCLNRTWVVDRIVDQAVVGVQAQLTIQQSDRQRCRLACFEERLFYCKSAMFDAQTRECRLYSIDRESTHHMRLLFTKGVDFFENQCQIHTSQCLYDAIERDMTIVTATKSLQGHSTFDCELACNQEQTFNCRSYTYLDNHYGSNNLPNICILSSDSRSTSQKGSVRERQRTLYAERNCFVRRPRIPTGTDSPSSSQPGVGDGINGPTSNQQSFAVVPTQTMEAGGGHLWPAYLESGRGGAGASQPSEATPHFGGCEPHQFTFERTFGFDYRFARRERAPLVPSLGIVIGCQQECLQRGDRCLAFVVEYSLPYQGCFLLDTSVGENKRLLTKAPNMAYFEKICLPRTGIENDLALANELPNLMEPPIPLLPPPSPSDHEPWAPISGGGSSSSTTSLVANKQYQQQQQQQQHLPYYMQQLRLVQHYPSRSCTRLWSFERFINSNFTMQPERMIPSVLSRHLCEQYCINEARFTCHSATYDYNNHTCRLFKETRRSTLSQFVSLDTSTNDIGTKQRPPQTGSKARQLDHQSLTNIDYLENQCVNQPSSCQYRPIYDSYSPYIDKLTPSSSLLDCQRQCDSERLFRCRAVNYDAHNRECMLLNEDLLTLEKGQQSLMPRKNMIYSEKGACELISVQCNPQEMLVSINFDTPFRGRILAKGNPEQCFIVGDGQTTIHFPIVFGPKCNSRQEGHNTFVNEVVIQQHPVIMTDSDKTVRVMCAFEAPDQTITLKNPTTNGNKGGIDVSTPENGRTRHDRPPFNSVISNKSSPPMVILRILDPSGRDAAMINLGDDLVLKIQMQVDGQQASALGIFARNLMARSSNGESLLLIDNEGCPVDNAVFPALEIDPKDGKSLYSTFKAFRFPSSGLVNFEVQIRFCPERCQPVQCQRGRLQSYGRRKRRRRKRETSSSVDHTGAASGFMDDPQVEPNKTATFIETISPTDPSNQAAATGGSHPKFNPVINKTSSTAVGSSLMSQDGGEIMKPGRAFQLLREMLLSDSGGFSSDSIVAPTNTTTTTTSFPMEDNGDQPTNGQSSANSSLPIDSDQHNNNENFETYYDKPASTMTLMIMSSGIPSRDNQSMANTDGASLPATLPNSTSPSPVSEVATGGGDPSMSIVLPGGNSPDFDFIMNDNTSTNTQPDSTANLDPQGDQQTKSTDTKRVENHDRQQGSDPPSDKASADYQSVVPPILVHVDDHVMMPVYPGTTNNNHIQTPANSPHNQQQEQNNNNNNNSPMQIPVNMQIPASRLDRSYPVNMIPIVMGDQRFSIPSMDHNSMTSSFELPIQSSPSYPATATPTSVTRNTYSNSATSVAEGSGNNGGNNYGNGPEEASNFPGHLDYSSTRWKEHQAQDQSSLTTATTTIIGSSTTTTGSIEPDRATDQPSHSSDDLPLKFSILVGDQNRNQNHIGSAIGTANWPASVAPNSGSTSSNNANNPDEPLIVGSNSSRQDSDDIVVPGNNKIYSQATNTDISAAPTDELNDPQMQVGLKNSRHPDHGSEAGVMNKPPISLGDENNSILQQQHRHHQQEHHSDQNRRDPSHGKIGPALTIPISRNNSPSTVSSSIGIDDQTSSPFDNIPSDSMNSLDPLLSQPTNNRSASTTSLQSQAELSSHIDCPIDNASRRLWLIVWTGTIVIALNVGLVVISLIIYFKKIHLSGRHNLAKSLHASAGCTRKRSKSGCKRNNDLSTSLEASEHFFAKLNHQSSGSSNSKNSSNGSSGGQRNGLLNYHNNNPLHHHSIGEFQWPNLSSSSSHSTISSITCAPSPAMTAQAATTIHVGHLLPHHLDISQLQMAQRSVSKARTHRQREFYNINEIDDDEEDDDIMGCNDDEDVMTCSVNHGFDHHDDQGTATSSTIQYQPSSRSGNRDSKLTSSSMQNSSHHGNGGNNSLTPVLSNDCSTTGNCHLKSKRYIGEDSYTSGGVAASTQPTGGA